MMVATLSGLGAAQTPAQIQAYQSSHAGLASEAQNFANFATQYGFHIVTTPPTPTCKTGYTNNCTPPVANASFQGPDANGNGIWLVPNDPNQTLTFAENYLGETVLPAWEKNPQSNTAQINAACGWFGSLLNEPGCPPMGLGAIPVFYMLGGGLLLLLLLTEVT